jgi:hypothetical protein
VSSQFAWLWQRDRVLSAPYCQRLHSSVAYGKQSRGECSDSAFLGSADRRRYPNSRPKKDSVPCVSLAAPSEQRSTPMLGGTSAFSPERMRMETSFLQCLLRIFVIVNSSIRQSRSRGKGAKRTPPHLEGKCNLFLTRVSAQSCHLVPLPTKSSFRRIGKHPLDPARSRSYVTRDCYCSAALSRLHDDTAKGPTWSVIAYSTDCGR